MEYRLEEARDLIVEAKYIIEDVMSKYNILGLKKGVYLDAVTELIGLLSKINDSKLSDLPIEALYKLLYRDYKNAKAEVTNLKKDLVDILERKDINEDRQVLIVKLMRAEREVESINRKLEARKEKSARMHKKYSDRIKELQMRLNEFSDSADEYAIDDENDEE